MHISYVTIHLTYDVADLVSAVERDRARAILQETLEDIDDVDPYVSTYDDRSRRMRNLRLSADR